MKDLTITIKTLRALLAEMEKYGFQSTTLHEIRTFALSQRLESNSKSISSFDKAISEEEK